VQCPKCKGERTDYQRSRKYKRRGKSYVAGIHHCYDCDELFEVEYQLPMLPGMAKKEAGL